MTSIATISVPPTAGDLTRDNLAVLLRDILREIQDGSVIVLSAPGGPLADLPAEILERVAVLSNRLILVSDRDTDNLRLRQAFHKARLFFETATADQTGSTDTPRLVDRVFVSRDILRQVYERAVAQTTVGSRSADPRSSAQQLMSRWLRSMAALGASDLHVDIDDQERTANVSVRVHGRLIRRVDQKPSGEGDGALLVSYNAGGAGNGEYNPAKPQHTVIAPASDDAKGAGITDLPLNVMQWRATYVPGHHGRIGSFRAQYRNRSALPVDQLGLRPADLTTITNYARAAEGLYALSGETGQGKTTLIRAVITMIHDIWAGTKRIISAENPPELNLPFISELVPATHDESLSMAALVALMLRLDLDISVIGEILDQATAHQAFTLLSAGHPMLTTIHARDALGVIERLANFGLPPALLYSPRYVRLVSTQRLAPTVCRYCGVTAETLSAGGVPHQLAKLDLAANDYRAWRDALEAQGELAAHEQIRERALAHAGAASAGMRDQLRTAALAIRGPGCPHCLERWLPLLQLANPDRRMEPGAVAWAALRRLPALAPVLGIDGQTMLLELVRTDRRLLDAMRHGDDLAARRHLWQRVDKNPHEMPDLHLCALDAMARGVLTPIDAERTLRAPFNSVEAREFLS